MTTAILLTIIGGYLIYRNYIYFYNKEYSIWGALLVLLVFVPLIVFALRGEL